MEVAVLHPHDCLKRHHHHRQPLISAVNKPRRFPSNVSPNSNPNPNRSNRRRRNSPPPPSNGPTKPQQPRPRSPPVPGQIRILKRGEEINLSPPPSPPPPMKPAPLRRAITGPILDGFYAGSAFVTSPAPSEVPLPGFFTRKNCGFVSGGEAHNLEIASELRKVLKLQI